MMENAERMCDAVCIIAAGEKVLDGDLATVRGAYAERTVALALDGEPSNGIAEVLSDRSLVRRLDDNNRTFEIELVPGGDPQLLLRRLIAGGAKVRRFELVQPSLHQIFLERVGAVGVEPGMTGNG
jgi:ABC-2 type transport system ATP-binding protein